MRQFIQNIIQFIAFFFVISSFIFLCLLGKKENFPALNFSNSYSFNEKVLFLKKQSVSPKIISVGSSMTLNNLDSEVILAEFNTKKYLNTASWGMCMQEIFNFLKLLNTLYDLEEIIIVSSIADFRESTKRIDFNFIKFYLTNNKPEVYLSFLKNFDLKYYINNIKYAKDVRKSHNDYQYLGYDSNGMVRLRKENFNIIKKRWLEKDLDRLSTDQYVYLDSISTFCKENDLKLYFFQSPHRESLLSEFNPQELDILNSHISRVNNILRNKHYFVNSNNKIWNDSLFVDGTHFNEIGAELFTKYCFDEIKKVRTDD